MNSFMKLFRSWLLLIVCVHVFLGLSEAHLLTPLLRGSRASFCFIFSLLRGVLVVAAVLFAGDFGNHTSRSDELSQVCPSPWTHTFMTDPVSTILQVPHPQPSRDREHYTAPEGKSPKPKRDSPLQEEEE